MPDRSTVVAVTILSLSAALADTAVGATPEEARFFESKIRPLLVDKCFKCHGEEKQRGKLRLDSLQGFITGGESGAAIVPGRPDESLLIEAINYESLEMPPNGKLADDEIALLTKWVAAGAPWPGQEPGTPPIREEEAGFSDEDRAFWSFQPLAEVTLPDDASDDWSNNEIDRFIRRKLKAAGSQPSPAANRRTIVCRLSFDLVGLPPTPDEIDAFVNDPADDAYEALVDRLLDSPHHGEHWARFWLDLVRYAESDGYKQDAYRPNAWRYRDYVVRAFNEDKPYDQFVMEQLAGDEIAPGNKDALAATAYLRHWIYEYNQRDVRTQWAGILNDITDVTADVFLGLSLSCSRCHDHKFDPILQEDYYRLQAFFTPLVPREDIPFADGKAAAGYHDRLAVWERETAVIRKQMSAIEAPHRQSVADAAINKFPQDIRPMMRKPESERTPFEQQLAALAYRQVEGEYARLKMEGRLKGKEKETWLALREQMKQHAEAKPSTQFAFTVRDVGPVAPATFIPGDRHERDIKPGFLTVLDDSDAVIEPPTLLTQSTGRRTALARWLVSPDNPLTARVIVNRVWQQHFGRGIVATASDFGRLGQPPTHPELLDWLARRFVEDGWSLKKLHRLIVTSATYQQQSSGSAEDNRLFNRMPIRRLSAEQIRDAALVVSGELQRSPGGPSVDADVPRRSVYVKSIRNRRDPVLAAFDAPDGFSSVAKRDVTTTPTQSLMMINGTWMLARAKALAKRLDEQDFADDAQLVDFAFRLCYGRPPTESQQQATVDFLAEGPRDERLVDFCHVLLNSNEFLYVD